MKIKLMLLSVLLASTGVNAATCLSKAEQRTVERNHKNSQDSSYTFVSINCNNTKLKAVCSDPLNVKMINTMMRINVWDEENALKIEYSARDLVELKKSYTNHLIKSHANCSSLKKEFFEAIGMNGGWDY